MYYDEGPEIKSKTFNTKDDNPRVILWTVLGTIAVLGALFGAFWWGQNYSSNSKTSSISSLSLSLSSSGSASSTGSTSSTSSTTSSESSSVVALTEYTDPDYPTFKLKHDASWVLSVENDPSGYTTFKKKTVSLVKTGNGSKLSIILDKSPHGASAFCLNSDQLVTLSAPWYRMRTPDGVRYFIREANIDFNAPFSAGPGADCPAETTASATNTLSIGGTTTSGHIDGIRLDLVGEDRAIADDLVSTVVF